MSSNNALGDLPLPVTPVPPFPPPRAAVAVHPAWGGSRTPRRGRQTWLRGPVQQKDPPGAATQELGLLPCPAQAFCIARPTSARTMEGSSSSSKLASAPVAPATAQAGLRSGPRQRQPDPRCQARPTEGNLLLRHRLCQEQSSVPLCLVTNRSRSAPCSSESNHPSPKSQG